MSAPCWATRRETDPRYDPASAAWAPDPCGHQPSCEDDGCVGFHDWGCTHTACLYSRMDAMCDLDKGHAGEHAFAPADEIVLVFEPAPPATEGGAP